MIYGQVDDTGDNPYDVGEIGCTVRPIDLGPILPLEDTCSDYLDELENFYQCKKGYEDCVAKKRDALVNFD